MIGLILTILLLVCNWPSEKKLKIVRAGIWIQIIARFLMDLMFIILNYALDYDSVADSTSVVGCWYVMMDWIQGDVTGFLVVSLILHILWGISTMGLGLDTVSKIENIRRLRSWGGITLGIVIYDFIALIYFSDRASYLWDHLFSFSYGFISYHGDSACHFGVAILPLYFSRGFFMLFNIVAMYTVYRIRQLLLVEAMAQARQAVAYPVGGQVTVVTSNYVQPAHPQQPPYGNQGYPPAYGQQPPPGNQGYPPGPPAYGQQSSYSNQGYVPGPQASQSSYSNQGYVPEQPYDPGNQSKERVY